MHASNTPPRNLQLATRQYARVLDQWIAAAGLDTTAYGTHTMRRTKARLIYKRTKNLRAFQRRLGRTKLERTVRYLEIEVDAVLEISEQTEIWRDGLHLQPRRGEWSTMIKPRAPARQRIHAPQV